MRTEKKLSGKQQEVRNAVEEGINKWDERMKGIFNYNKTICTVAEIDLALGKWRLIVSQDNCETPGNVRIRIKKPWYFLGNKFCLWVERRIRILMCGKLPMCTKLDILYGVKK